MRTPRPIAAAAAVALLLVLLPLPAAAQDAAGVVGTPDADQQGTRAYDGTGPVLPAPDYIAPFDAIESPDRARRLVPDGAGHLLIQGYGEVGGESVDRLVALDPADGSEAWIRDGIEQACLPVATEDGRVFAQLERNVDVLGESTPSYDPVELDADTGQPTNRYVAAGTEEERNVSQCTNELRLGADGVLLAYLPANGYTLRAWDTTVQPMAQLYDVEVPGARSDGALDRMVLSPDGATAYLGSHVEGSTPPQLVIHAFDVATGDEVGSAVVPGTVFSQDGLLLTGDTLLVETRATGGHDDPPRLIALDADTLDQRWVLTGGDDHPFELTGRMAVAGDVVVVYASDTLVGVGIADGAVRWTHDLTSFSNNGAQVVTDAAGTVYASTFGGAVLEVVDGATGEALFVSGDQEEYLGDVTGEATLGPILDDGRLYGLHRLSTDGRPVLIAYDEGSARLDGGTGEPVDVAIELCRYLFDDGEARTVVLSRDDLFADTLAGAPLAGDHSCILFTTGGPDAPIDPDTRAEIARALPPGGTVRIAGGTTAVSAQVEATLRDDGFAVERLAGPGRVQTAVAIADVVVAENPGVDQAVLAFAGDWPDAVTGGAAASAAGAPVLLTGTDAVPADTAAALQRYGVRTTSVVGGTAVIADSVLADVPGGRRIAGDTRHSTAAAVADQLWGDLARERALVLANLEVAQGWSLALAAAPLSVRLGAPQLGVRDQDLPEETAAYLRGAGIVDPGLLVLGDLTVVSDGVVEAVGTATAG